MKNTALILFIVLSIHANAQDTTSTINRTQMTVMVVPFTTKGEDIRTKIESDFAYRSVINTIDKAFRDRGFSTKGFLEELKAQSTAELTNTMTQQDLFTRIQQNAPCDIFIYAEINIVSGNSGNYVNITLDAKDKYSAETMAASGLLTSNINYSTDYARLAEGALTKNGTIDKFIEAMDVKFKDISKTGRSLEVVLELQPSSPHSFDDEYGDDYSTLSEIITNHVKKTAFGNYYKLKSSSAKKLWFETIKIPIRNIDGTQYRIEDYATQFYKFLRGLSKQSKKGEIQVEKFVTTGKILFQIK